MRETLARHLLAFVWRENRSVWKIYKGECVKGEMTSFYSFWRRKEWETAGVLWCEVSACLRASSDVRWCIWKDVISAITYLGGSVRASVTSRLNWFKIANQTLSCLCWFPALTQYMLWEHQTPPIWLYWSEGCVRLCLLQLEKWSAAFSQSFRWEGVIMWVIEASGAEVWPCRGGGKVGRHGEMWKKGTMGCEEWDGGLKGGNHLLFIFLRREENWGGLIAVCLGERPHPRLNLLLRVSPAAAFFLTLTVTHANKCIHTHTHSI